MRFNADSMPINAHTHLHKEPPLMYGTAFLRHLTNIWCLRDLYPGEDILLFDDDVKSCFRHAKINLEITTAFAFILQSFLCIPIGQVFGSNTSPSNWEPFAQARCCLAEFLLTDNQPKHSHNELLDKVEFSPTPQKHTEFSPAWFVSNNERHNIRRNKKTFNMFVDDSLYAALRFHMYKCMYASIESLYLLLGRPVPALRQSCLALDKFLKTKCSYLRTQLGLDINTRTMWVTIPEAKLKKLKQLIRNWHHHRKSYTLQQAANLVGSLQHVGQICPWLKYLLTSLHDAIRLALRKHKQSFLHSEEYAEHKQFILYQEHTPIAPHKRAFALSKLLKGTWATKTKLYITKPLKDDLALLHSLLFSTHVRQWGSPIAHLVERRPDFQCWGDASLFAGGAFSLHLRFWWHIQWPHCITCRTINTISYWSFDHDALVSINALEFAVIIISYAAACDSFALMKHHATPYPVLLNWCDNTTSSAWIARASRSSAKGKALGRILCSYMINSPLAIRSNHIKGTLNYIADKISRTHSSYSYPNFTTLLQDIPQLRSCRRYHPNPELVSAIFQALCFEAIPNPTKIILMGRFESVPGGFSPS